MDVRSGVLPVSRMQGRKPRIEAGADRSFVRLVWGRRRISARYKFSTASAVKTSAQKFGARRLGKLKFALTLCSTEDYMIERDSNTRGVIPEAGDDPARELRGRLAPMPRELRLQPSPRQRRFARTRSTCWSKTGEWELRSAGVGSFPRRARTPFRVRCT